MSEWWEEDWSKDQSIKISLPGLPPTTWVT